MTAFITVGGMIVGGCFGGSLGALEDRGSDLPGFGFMIYGLCGTVLGGLAGAVIGAVVT